jgi:hypothetical protein
MCAAYTWQKRWFILYYHRLYIMHTCLTIRGRPLKSAFCSRSYVWPTLLAAVHTYDRLLDCSSLSQVVYRGIGNGSNQCARRIHDKKVDVLSLSMHHAHLSNYTREVAQVCLLLPTICMTSNFSNRSYIWPVSAFCSQSLLSHCYHPPKMTSKMTPTQTWPVRACSCREQSLKLKSDKIYW